MKFEGLGMVRIQNQPVVADSAEVFSKVFDVGAMRVTGVLAEVDDLVICIGDVTSLALIEEVELS